MAKIIAGVGTSHTPAIGAAIDLGGVSYALAKLAFTDEHSYQYMAAEMCGLTQEEYAAMMMQGGRKLDGWRSKKERGEA